MGYGSYYRELLEPLGLYAFAEGGLSAAEADALGEAMDALLENLDATEREATLATAEDAGLSSYEALLPFRPVSDTLASRRQALAALLRIDGCSFTLDALQATLSGCGIPATVSETGEHFVVEVRFPEHRGIPQALKRLPGGSGRSCPAIWRCGMSTNSPPGDRWRRPIPCGGILRTRRRTGTPWNGWSRRRENSE